MQEQNPPPVRSRPLVLWTVAAFAVLAAAAAVRVRDWSYGADTGTFVQIVLDGWGGMHNGVEQTTHYRFHWSPVLALLTPLVRLSGPLAGWVLQAIAAAAAVACAPLLAAIARPRVPAFADRIGAVALLYPPLVALGFGEFRDLVLLPPLALGWWLALERRAWAWVLPLAAVMALLREDVCLELAVVGTGLALAAVRGGDRARAAAAGASAVLGLISVACYAVLVLPRVGPWPPSHFYSYPFANGPRELLLAPLTHPLAFLAAIATVGRLTYLLEAFVPLALLPLRSRRIWAALPGFAIVLLANSGLVWRMGMHYAALWIPWTLIALPDAIGQLRRPARWTNAVLVLCAIVLVAFSPLHPTHYLKPSYHALDDARRALACVPRGAWVATHDEWFSAEAATRPGVAVISGDLRPETMHALYLVVAEDYPNRSFQDEAVPQLHALVRSGVWRPVCRFGAVTTYIKPF